MLFGAFFIEIECFGGMFLKCRTDSGVHGQQETRTVFCAEF